MTYTLPVFATIVALASLYLTRKTSSTAAFFEGKSESGIPPGLWTLVLSQTTTWIFARSLMNAAILGYYYGLWGTLAYAAYYLSFLTGAVIVDQVRFRYGHDSIQHFLRERFGKAGPWCYNAVVALRLISEVFANLLVIGILFGAAGGSAYTLSIAAFAIVTLLYAMMGGLQASLRTDVFQMLLFIATLVILMIITLATGYFTTESILFKPFVLSEPGPILLIVALLQVVSYPMHDPVMMDRGFLADRETTRKSFYHACWISVLCIISFGSLGIIAGAQAIEGEQLTVTLTRLLGDIPMMFFSAALIVSAMSTLDSTLSSSAKLVVIDMGAAKKTLFNGRAVMAIFMLMGLGFILLNNKDLFSAVAVSGTASMYLFPVIIFSLLGNQRDIPVACYLLSFVIAVGAAALYFFETTAGTGILGDAHKYTKLLWICCFVLISTCLSFWVGIKLRSPHVQAAD